MQTKHWTLNTTYVQNINAIDFAGFMKEATSFSCATADPETTILANCETRGRQWASEQYISLFVRRNFVVRNLSFLLESRMHLWPIELRLTILDYDFLSSAINVDAHLARLVQCDNSLSAVERAFVVGIGSDVCHWRWQHEQLLQLVPETSRVETDASTSPGNPSDVYWSQLTPPTRSVGLPLPVAHFLPVGRSTPSTPATQNHRRVDGRVVLGRVDAVWTDCRQYWGKTRRSDGLWWLHLVDVGRCCWLRR